ncbi:hypothetical protein [Paraburkholderia tuberum]|uniref:Transcriptional regulator n=1 Tax=Paraburkholderia tuberum TaxID=157910 RepID=A0A1H0ZPP1_9BURK|nr:hypothetical protein [Paraburkholderia tuberum]SDQ29458.1 hypothetical protein SAMN05445850_0153 [Paraburkholderia tuberum]
MTDILVLVARVHWLDVLADLRATGVSGYRLTNIMLTSRSTVQSWEKGSEPSHSYGIAILEVHTRFCGEALTAQRVREARLVW